MSEEAAKPEDIPEADGADGERPTAATGSLLADIAGGLTAALRPLSGLTAMTDDIREMVGYVRKTASNTNTLPDVAETLHAIREHTEHMDKEVAEMHAAVEELKVMLEPIAVQLESVTRLTNRLPGGRKYRRAQAEADAASSAEDAALEAEAMRVEEAEEGR